MSKINYAEKDATRAAREISRLTEQLGFKVVDLREIAGNGNWDAVGSLNEIKRKLEELVRS